MAPNPSSGERALHLATDSSVRRSEVENDLGKTTVTTEQVLKYVVAAVSGAVAAATIYWGLVGRVTDTGSKADAQFTAVVAKIDSLASTVDNQAKIQALRDEASAKDTAWLKGQVTMQGLDIRNIQLALAEKGFKISPQ